MGCYGMGYIKTSSGECGRARVQRNGSGQQAVTLRYAAQDVKSYVAWTECTGWDVLKVQEMISSVVE